MMKPIVTEKAVMAIESKNTLLFETEKEKTKAQIKQEIEEMFNVKVADVKTRIHKNKKYANVKLKKDFPAIDIATKLGLI